MKRKYSLNIHREKKHKHKIRIENKGIISGNRKSEAFKVITGHKDVS